MSEQKKFFGLGLWQKATGSACSHHQGLTAEELAFFHDLKAGDRIILYPQDKGENPNRPDFRLQRFARQGEKGWKDDMAPRAEASTGESI